MAGVLFDLDQTLINSSIAEALRKQRKWAEVYPLIPQFSPYEGVADLLAMLVERDVPLGIVTSSPRPYCIKVIEFHSFRIDKLVCYHDTNRRKPHPDPILKGIELLGVPANAVWAIGDQPKDIEAAEKAGAHVVAVTWGTSDPEELRASGAEYLFDTVKDLHDFLAELTS